MIAAVPSVDLCDEQVHLDTIIKSTAFLGHYDNISLYYDIMFLMVDSPFARSLLSADGEIKS